MKTYSTPVLSVYGDAVALIQGTGYGPHLDSGFCNGGDHKPLTFSGTTEIEEHKHPF